MKEIGNKIKIRKREISAILLIGGVLLISMAMPIINGEKISSKNSVKGNTIYVPDEYAKIQWAIDNATDGDTIIVRDGTYYEHIVVNKSITLKSENGSANCTIDGNGTGTVVKITANNVTIEGFTITGSGSNWPNAGLKIESSGNIITYNSISNNRYDGIILGSSSNNNIITHNNISNNNGDGIYLDSSSNNNIITYNNISNNWYGIYLVSSSNNNITYNTMKNDGIVIWGYTIEQWNTHIIENNTVNGKPIYYFKNKIGGKVPEDAGQVILANCTGMKIENLTINNTDVGIELGFSTKNTIKNNTISNNNGDGIYLRSSSNNNITYNTISNNNWYGIYLGSSSNNNITYNNISNNWYGIWLYSSSNNNITHNTISNNHWEGIWLDSSSNNNIITYNTIFHNWKGIYLDSSSNNLIYLNNFIDNANQVDTYYSTNRWYSPTPLNYTYNGTNYTNYLGNYWSDYNGSDTDGDGIGDTPYTINSNNADNYPLMGAWQNGVILTEDTTPPQITITSPSNNSIINNSTVTISWQGSDFWTGIDHYEIKIDNGSWINVGLNTLYTTQLSDGVHTVYVKAVDKAGNSAIDSVTFTVNAPVPEFNGLFVNPLIFTLLALGIIPLLRKKKNRKISEK